VNKLRLLFYGYNNHVEFGTNDGRPFELIAENAEILDTAYSMYSRENTMTLIPRAYQDVRVLMVDPKSKLAFDTLSFNIVPLPDPEIYWGSVPSGGKAAKYETRLLIRYPPQIPLAYSHWEIMSWELIIPELAKPITGSGNDISGAQEAIKKLSFGEKVKVSCTIKGSDGTQRRISAVFNF
jgi:hypothetical protein